MESVLYCRLQYYLSTAYGDIDILLSCDYFAIYIKYWSIDWQYWYFIDIETNCITEHCNAILVSTTLTTLNHHSTTLNHHLPHWITTLTTLNHHSTTLNHHSYHFESPLTTLNHHSPHWITTHHTESPLYHRITTLHWITTITTLNHHSITLNHHSNHSESPLWITTLTTLNHHSTTESPLSTESPL